MRSTSWIIGGSTGSTQLSPGRVSLRSLLPKSAVLDYWRFTSLAFRYDFAKAKSALHQLVHRDVTSRLRRRRTCQNPQKKDLVLSRSVRLNKKRELYTLLKYLENKKLRFLLYFLSNLLHFVINILFCNDFLTF